MLGKFNFAGLFGTTFVVLLAFSSVTNAETNPFALGNSTEGFTVADHEAKCGDSMKKGAKCGDSMKMGGKCGRGVDMQGNVVKLGTFRYGGDNMAKYADGKLGTGVKDPSVCGTYEAGK